MAEVVLEHVYKIYPGDKGPDVIAVNDFNLRIENEEFIVLVGPSGCGKSTTLRMIAGLEDISKGDVFIDGRRVNDVPPKDRDIAMVFQNYALYPHMTVRENMAFGLKLRDLPRTEIDQRVNEAAVILGLSEEMLSRKPKALSGGQRQRVAVGRAIVRKPKAFLFDEPLSNLDAKMRVQMRTEISRLHTRLASTMIYVTHDQVEAMTMGDRIVVMKDGLVQQIADPLTIYHHPANMFVAGFIGSPAINLLHGALQSGPDGLVFVEDAGPGAAGIRIGVADEHARKLEGRVGKPIVYGIRPEDLEDKLYAPDAPPAAMFRATVEVVEPLGSETYLYLTTGRHSLVARSKGGRKVEVNRPVELVADRHKAHFFDPATETALV